MVCKLLFLLLILISTPALAGTNVSFIWQPNTEPDLAGYRLFRSTVSGQYDYTNPVADIPCGANDTTCCRTTDPNVPDGTYYWVLRAYDSEGYESVDSNEETTTLISTPPEQPQHLTIEKEEVSQ